MQLDEKLRDLRDQLLSDLGKKAKEGDTKEVISISKALEELEQIENTLNNTRNKLEILINRINNNYVNFTINSRNNTNEYNTFPSAKEIGRQRRDKFITLLRQKGFNVEQHRSVVYEINKSKVGIATASSIYPRKWFLGLPNDDFETVVLITESEDKKELTHFIFSKSLFNSIKNRLSRGNKGKQLKFNIKTGGSNYYLVIPGIEDININNTINNFENLNNL